MYMPTFWLQGQALQPETTPYGEITLPSKNLAGPGLAIENERY